MLRDRLVEDMIIDRVKQVSPVGPTGDKVTDIAVHRWDCDRPLHRKVFYREAHGEFFLQQHEIFLCYIWNAVRPDLVTSGVSLMTKYQQFVTGILSHVKLQPSYARSHGSR
jgi:hypothetical protein